MKAGMMVRFEDSEENGRSFLNVLIDSKAGALKQTFVVYPSMLRPTVSSKPDAIRAMFPTELTPPLSDVAHGGPAYLLKSVMKETESDDVQPPLLGRRIINGIVRWGPNSLRIIGDFTHIPLYWEWTEDVIARCSKRLRDANIYDAVYASLYQYDRDPCIVRAFVESWCPSTNTLQTIAGEWSISLWDLHKIGGLPVAGCRYDEAIPSFRDMRAPQTSNARPIPRACEHLFAAYCLLAALPDSKGGVSVTQWVHYWCKQAPSYPKPGKRRSRKPDTRPKSNLNPRREIPEKPLEWTFEEMTIFTELGVADHSERKTTYLAAYLSSWLCAFVLPEEEDPLIRPTTFEVAAHMARGNTFSLAPPVLSSLYHGLNKMVHADKPTYSGSAFPSHYLYGWLAHYFDTYHVLDDAPLGPLMARYSGVKSAKAFTDVEARDLIHDGSSFKASSLVLRGNRCAPVCDDKLDISTLSYIISLRTAYLPLRRKTSFFLEPYHPTRFSRQFGFYQDVPGILPRKAGDGSIRYDAALKQLRFLLFKDSRTKLVLPGRFSRWMDMTTPSFKHWWAKVTVSDLRKNINSLASSVDYRTKGKAMALDVLPPEADGVIGSQPNSRKKVMATSEPRKRTIDGCDGDENVNHKRPHVYEEKKAQVHQQLFGQEGDPDFDGEEAPRGVVPATISDTVDEVLVDNEGENSMQPAQQASDALPSSPLSLSTTGSSTEVAAAPPSSSQTVKMTNQVVTVLLQNLMDASYEEVNDVAAQVTSLLPSLRGVGDDISILQAAIDAYVKGVVHFVAAQQDAIGNAAQRADEISAVEDNLRSARVAHQGAIQTSKSLAKQEDIAAKAVEAAEAKLRALRDGVKSIKRQQSRQVEVISEAESKVDALQRELDELRASQASSDDLVQAESELERCKKAIKAVIR